MPAHEKDEEDEDCKPEIIMILGPEHPEIFGIYRYSGGVNWATPTSQYQTCCPCLYPAMSRNR